MMSSIQSFTSYTRVGATGDYDVGSDVLIDYDEHSALSVYYASRTENSWCKINETGKSKLFPNASAKPIKADIIYNVGAIGSGEARFYVGGSQIFNDVKSGSDIVTKNHTGLTNAVIVNSTRETEIKWVLAHDALSGLGIGEIYLRYYFTRYDFSAVSGEGTVASISKSTGYGGDTITYSASVENGYKFLGWYNGSSLVSASQEYRYTVSGADLTLTARAKRVFSTPVKVNGAWKNAVTVKTKVGGAWKNAASVLTKVNGAWKSD